MGLFKKKQTQPPAELPEMEARQRRGSYTKVFLKHKDFKARQPVYISPEIHKEIRKIVNLLALSDREISMGAYINNILADHLEQYRDDIIAELRCNSEL